MSPASDITGSSCRQSLNSDGLCYKCSKNKVTKENIKYIENNIKQQINQETKKVNTPNIDVYIEEQNQNLNTYQKSYWHWFGYLWNIFINIFIIFVILNIYSNITTPFEKIVVSLLILIYISLQTFSMVQGKINAEKIFFLYDQFKNIRNLLKEEIEEDEEQEIKQAKDKIKKVTVKIYINAFFLTIIYFIAIINIVFIN